jgi:hypothetical protein
MPERVCERAASVLTEPVRRTAAGRSIWGDAPSAGVAR